MIQRNDETGNMGCIPHEVTEKLAMENLTSREFRLVFFFMRELQGYQMKEKLIKTCTILERTKLSKQKVIPALKSMIKKKVIERRSVGKSGEYIYSFNEDFFGRTHATKEIRFDPKVVDLMTYKASNHANESVTSEVPEAGTKEYPNQVPSSTQIRYPQVPESGTSRAPETATSAAQTLVKDSLKDNKNILKRENQEEISSLSGNGNGEGADADRIAAMLGGWSKRNKKALTG